MASEAGVAGTALRALVALGSEWLGKETVRVRVLQAFSISLKRIKLSVPIHINEAIQKHIQGLWDVILVFRS